MKLRSIAKGRGNHPGVSRCGRGGGDGGLEGVAEAANWLEKSYVESLGWRGGGGAGERSGRKG